MQPNIIQFPRMMVIGVPYFGNASNGAFGKVWGRLGPLLQQVPNQKMPKTMLGVEAYTDDMQTSGQWFYLAGVEVSSLDEVPVQLDAKVIPAHSYAVFDHVGRLPGTLAETFAYAYKTWLPQSGYQQAAPFDLERYDARYLGNDNPASVVQVCIPVVAKAVP